MGLFLSRYRGSLQFYCLRTVVFAWLLLVAFPVICGGIDGENDRERWPNMINMLNDSMNNGNQTILEAQDLSEQSIKKYQEICAKVERRCSELNFLLWSQPRGAILGISIAMYCQQIVDLECYFNAETESFKRILNIYKLEHERGLHLNTMLEQVNPKYLDANALAERDRAHKRMLRFIASVSECCKKIETALNASSGLQNELSRLVKEADKRNEHTFKKILLNPQINFWENLPTLQYSLYFWFSGIHAHIQMQLPNKVSFWLKFILLAVFGGMLHVLAGRRLLRWLEKLGMIYWWQQQKWVFSLGWTSLGIALLFSTCYFWLSTVEFGLFSRVAMIFFGLAAVMLTLGIRLKPEYHGAVFRLYLPLLLLYILGNILWTLVVTIRPLIFIWTLANIPVFIMTAYVLIRHKMQILDLVLGILTIIMSLFAAIAAARGYGYLALAVMMIWFLAATGIQLGASLTILLWRFKPRTTHRQIVVSFFLTIVLPLIWIAIIGGLAYWAATIFNMQESLENGLVTNLCPHFSSLKITIRDIVFSLIAGLLLYFVISTIKIIIWLVYREQANIGIMASVLTLGTYCAWFVYVIFLLLLFEVEYSSILVVLGGMSMGIGFGLRDVIENFICGVILLAGKEVRPGDIIEFDGTWGTVEKISIRATMVKTFDNAVINLPNSVVSSKNFKNWTLTGKEIRKDIKVSVVYGSDVDMIKKLLFEIAGEQEDILGKPAPDVLYMDFSAKELVFILRVWFNDLNKAGQCQSKLHEEIDRRFRANNIIMA